MRTPHTTPGAPESAAPDVELVARMAERDVDALEALHRRFAGTLLALCRRILGGSPDAEDVVQEVFVQAWRQAGRYDPSRSSVSSWLVLIARSRAIDRLRQHRTVARVASEAAVASPAPTHASPEGVRTVFFAERRQRIRRALEALPPEQREVIELAFFRGMTQSEIAQDTGIPLGTVKTRTLLAMKKLRLALESDLRDLL